MGAFLDALLLQSGPNAALVSSARRSWGLAAGRAGTFLVLRKRALVADAMAHATLPGVALAFLVMVASGGEGRALSGLMLGSAATALLGLLAVDGCPPARACPRTPPSARSCRSSSARASCSSP
jgi:manganese/zinc/iron transport system permease protein